jgi:hypothetical protein
MYRTSDEPKTLAFQDFTAAVTTREGLFFNTQVHESFQTAVAAANEWIRQCGIEVANVETVVLPNMYASREEGTTDSELKTASGDLDTTQWHQFVRVWHWVVSPQPQS